MATNNCLFSPASENPGEFSVWGVLVKFSINQRNYSQPGPLKNLNKQT